MTPVVRPSVRVLLLDDADRLLLFRGVSDETGEAFWYPAGGAIEPGEGAREAAVREIREETGAEVEIGAEVWSRRHVVPWGGVTYDCRERWFLARVAAFEIDTSGFTPEEVVNVTGHHWWTPAELTAATDRLVPADLARLLAALLADGPPAVPVEVGI
jgi:8-oxo-dGTP pyrophosphatase MutT (NUDIX family)